MNEAKSFWKSKTVIASLVGVAAVVLDLFGLSFGERAEVTDAVFKIVEGGSFLVAAWGRLTATARLT